MAIILNHDKHNDVFFDFENSNFARGAGSIDNNKIKICKICATNGFPHEAIIFQKVKGRILSDGTNEIRKWRIVDYFQPWRLHKHEQRRGNF